MEKEKIVLGNGTEVSYDSISAGNGCMVISVIGGDSAVLEQTFRVADQTNLESIRQIDVEGGEQAVHNRYDIFRAVNKKIAADPDTDVVEIVLEQETEVAMEIRHLKEVTDALLMEQLA